MAAKVLPPPPSSGNAEMDRWMQSLYNLVSPKALTLTGLLDLSAATAGQIKFPATQNASSDANTLDDYKEFSSNPTPAPGSGAFTSVTCSYTHTKVGNRVMFDVLIHITTNGTAAGYITVPMPITPAVACAAAGKETALNGKTLACDIRLDGNLYISFYDGTYPGASGADLRAFGEYRV